MSFNCLLEYFLSPVVADVFGILKVSAFNETPDAYASLWANILGDSSWGTMLKTWKSVYGKYCTY